MAYALGFPKDVTDCIYGMRDFRWETVRDGGKTPSESCFDVKATWKMMPGGNLIATNAGPTLVAYGMPTYTIVGSDSADSDFEVGYIHGDDGFSCWIEQHNPSKCWQLRCGYGKRERRNRRLQRRSDRRIHNTFFQCEPCVP